jgi:hypothetical protein
MHYTESNLDNTPLLKQDVSMFDGVQNTSDTVSALGSPTESTLEPFSMVGSGPLFNYTHTPYSNNSVHNPLGKHHPQQLHRASSTKKKRVRFHSRTTVYPARGRGPLKFATDRAKRFLTGV